MSSQAQSGLNSTISINVGPTSAPSWAQLGEIASANTGNRRSNALDITNLADTSVQFMGAVVTSGTVEISGNRVQIFVPTIDLATGYGEGGYGTGPYGGVTPTAPSAGQDKLEAAFTTCQLAMFQVALFDGDVFTFSAAVAEYNPIAEISTSGQIKFTASLLISGPLTSVLAAPVIEGLAIKAHHSFTDRSNAVMNHGMGTMVLFSGFWDASGKVVECDKLQLTSGHTAVARLNVPMSGTVKLSVVAYTQTFDKATSVTVTHNLNSFDILPVIYDSAYRLIEPSSFALTGSNTATVTFDEPQSGSLGLIVGAYAREFVETDSVTVTHGLESTQLAVACYDTGNNLIGFDEWEPKSPDTAVLTFTAPQTGRAVVSKP